jgi:hypothetical protein
MAEEKIILLIDDEGSVSAKTSGFKGDTCLDALDKLLESQPITAIKTTDEYAQEVNNVTLTKVKVKR